MHTIRKTSLAVAVAIAVSDASAFFAPNPARPSNRHTTRTRVKYLPAFAVGTAIATNNTLEDPGVFAEDEDFTKLDTSILFDGKASAKTIFLVSDGTGVTLKSALTRALGQFNSCGREDQRSLNVPKCNDEDEEEGEDFSSSNEISTREFTYVRSESALESIVRKAEEKGAMIVFTVADPVLRDKTMRMAELSGVRAVDLFGPLWKQLSDYLDADPAGVPMGPRRAARPRALSSAYYRRIEAVEFTLKADDGRSPWLLKEADVILVGVSRTGKTPLSVVLSHTMGLKVANVPLVLEVPPPPELLDEETIDPNRVFCLSINPNQLRRIRTARLERRNVRAVEEKRAASAPSRGGGREGESNRQSTYADREYVLKDLKRARDLAQAKKWSTVDVTGRAVEESASLIGEMLNERFAESVEPIY